MDDPISPARRTLLKAGAATLATPVAAAIAQPAAAVGRRAPHAAPDHGRLRRL
jgi:hypothetical protein